MKTIFKTFVFILISILSFSCFKPKDKQGAVTTHKEAVDTLRVANVPNDSLPKFTILKDKKILNEVDLSKLLVNTDEFGEYSNNFNGFFGKDNYRIQIYFKKAWKDSLDSKKYHLIGMTNFKGNIDDFKGMIVIDSVFEFVDPLINYKEVYQTPVNTYEIRGKLTMKEDSLDKHAGSFAGTFLMDFSIDSTKTLDYWYYSPNTAVQGGGFKSEGTWKIYAGKLEKPYVFGRDFFMFANNILKDFSFGERDIEINKKYLHLGWDNFWENDEWWAKKPVM
ncbi:MAG: hypothetical protein IPO04_21840 [Cytophagaceae bacterium]|nr:hypothetical protein [Cytophagaceae bacterium]